MSKTKVSVDVFTQDEHAVLADWFRCPPACKLGKVTVDEALERLGFEREPDALYTSSQAAVASIVLESAETRLPQWAAVGEHGVLLARSYRDPEQKPLRKATLLPRRLFTINWASSGPGYSWPTEYRVSWVPLYD